MKEFSPGYRPTFNDLITAQPFRLSYEWKGTVPFTPSHQNKDNVNYDY